MHKLISLVLVASLGGCVLVTDDDPGRHHYVPYPEPTPQPRPQPQPAVYTLDCGWLASWNCWDTAVSEAKACAPQTYAGPDGGVYGDFGHACYYPDGSAVFFENGVTVPLAPDHLWSFSIEDPWGDTCAWFVETETSLSIGTASGVVDFVVDAAGVSVTCQDGTQWYHPDPYALSYCASAEWDSPGYWREAVGASTTFGLLGGDQPPLWSCDW